MNRDQLPSRRSIVSAGRRLRPWLHTPVQSRPEAARHVGGRRRDTGSAAGHHQPSSSLASMLRAFSRAQSAQSVVVIPRSSVAMLQRSAASA